VDLEPTLTSGSWPHLKSFGVQAPNTVFVLYFVSGTNEQVDFRANSMKSRLSEHGDRQ
jgi:hypothetical protein